jgi:hypothetical protein
MRRILYIGRADRQAESYTNRQMDRQAGIWTGKQIGRRAGSHESRQADRQIDKRTDDCMTWRADWETVFA